MSHGANSSLSRRGQQRVGWMLILATLVAACGGGAASPTAPSVAEPSASSSAQPSLAAPPANLVVWSSVAAGSPGATAQDEFFTGYEADHPGTTIEVRHVDAQSFDQQFKSAVAAGEPVDLIQVNIQFYRDYVRLGLLENVTEPLDAAGLEYDQVAWDQLKVFALQDAIFGLPMMLATTGFYYNKEVFEAQGLSQPTTWDDVRAMRDTLEPAGIAPIVYAGKEVWWNRMWFNLFFYQHAGSPAEGIRINDSVMQGTTSFEQDIYRESIEDVASLESDRIWLEGTQGLDFAAATSAFVQGKAAMFYMGTWFTSSLPEDFDYGVFPVPVLEAGNTPMSPGSVTDIWSIGSGSANKEAATALLLSLATPEWQEAYLTQPGAGVPLQASLQGINPLPVMRDFEKIGPNTAIWLDALWEPEIISAVQTGVQSAILGEKTAAEVTAEIAALYDQLRAEGKTFFKP